MHEAMHLLGIVVDACALHEVRGGITSATARTRRSDVRRRAAMDALDARRRTRRLLRSRPRATARTWRTRLSRVHRRSEHAVRRRVFPRRLCALFRNRDAGGNRQPGRWCICRLAAHRTNVSRVEERHGRGCLPVLHDRVCPKSSAFLYVRRRTNASSSKHNLVWTYEQIAFAVVASGRFRRLLRPVSRSIGCTTADRPARRITGTPPILRCKG